MYQQPFSNGLKFLFSSELCREHIGCWMLWYVASNFPDSLNHISAQVILESLEKKPNQLFVIPVWRDEVG
jgi:hypothetical protein